MTIQAKYVHTNIVSKNWEQLTRFYEKVFGCKRVLPERDLSGRWIEDGTGIPDVRIKGIHLRLPGYGESGPTLEIFQYNKYSNTGRAQVNQPGFAHIAFSVDDVEDALDVVLSEGGGQLGKVVTKEIPGIGTLMFVYAKDLEGNIIELQNWKK